MAIESHTDLEVWQMARSLAIDCYRLTTDFPKHELYGMTSQIRRASVSVPSNIAEGFGRDQTGAFVQFLRISQGSVRELETLPDIAHGVRLTTGEAVASLLEKSERVSRMLRSLIRTLDARRSSQE
jgi:four helix bundle protein